MNQRNTHAYTLPQSVSDLDRQYIKLIIFFLFAPFQKKKLLHSLTQNNRSIHLFGMFSKHNHTASQHSFIKSNGAKKEKIEHSKKLVRTSFVIDDEESNHVNLAFCCTLSLFYYSISIFLARSKRMSGRKKRREVKKKSTTTTNNFTAINYFMN